MNREIVRDIFHLKVLEAIDDAARECFADVSTAIDPPAVLDDETAFLFRVIDNQIDRIAHRYNIALVDWDPAHPWAVAGPAGMGE